MKHKESSISTIRPADIIWKQGEPISRQFDDVYFSSFDGLAESEYVFLKHNKLPQAWHSQQRFVIAETGFGSGLNFLLTIKHWLQSRPVDSHLFYYSTELYPLSRHDLIKALAAFPQLKHLSTELIEAYPPLLPGFHYLSLFDNRVTLCLMFGDAHEQLEQMHAQVDAWYLDGFAPSKNPDMWRDQLFREMARLSHTGTSFSTFTSAGFVRRGLEQAGFEVIKTQGYGPKREMLCGSLSKPASIACRQPWYELAETDFKQKRVAVVGAGIAGVTTAWALAKRGWQVDLIEQHQAVAEEASGNPMGVVMPRLSLDDSAEAEFHSSAFGLAVRTLNRIKRQYHDLAWLATGVLQLPSSKRVKKQMAQLEAPDDYVQVLNPQQASDIAGIQLEQSALYFPQAGCLNAKSLCQLILSQYRDAIRWYPGSKVSDIGYHDECWQTFDPSNRIITDTNALVLCDAMSIKQYTFTRWLDLQPVRGQVSYLSSNQTSRHLKTAICFEGYVLPEHQQQHLIGASFKPGDIALELREEEHEDNLAALSQCLPDLFDRPEQWQGRAAIRVVSADRIPVLGPVADIDWLQQAYADLQKGKPATQYPKAKYVPGLYVNSAHGARGLTTGFLSAEIIAAQMNNEPLPVSKRVAHVLSPSRFVIRALKKGQSI